MPSSVRGNQKNPSTLIQTTASPRSCRAAHGPIAASAGSTAGYNAAGPPRIRPSCGSRLPRDTPAAGTFPPAEKTTTGSTGPDRSVRRARSGPGRAGPRCTSGRSYRPTTWPTRSAAAGPPAGTSPVPRIVPGDSSAPVDPYASPFGGLIHPAAAAGNGPATVRETLQSDRKLVHRRKLLIGPDYNSLLDQVASSQDGAQSHDAPDYVHPWRAGRCPALAAGMG